MSKVSCANGKRVLDLVTKLYLEETLAKLYEEQRETVRLLIKLHKQEIIEESRLIGHPVLVDPSPFKHWRKV